MTPLFADTFYFLAMLNPGDEDHAKVKAFNATLRQPLLTTVWVLTEVGDALATPENRGIFKRFLDRLQNDRRVTIVPASNELFEDGAELYDQRPDKAWSLTDCISFFVMQEHGLTEALTKDRHFEQAGFTALLK